MMNKIHYIVVLLWQILFRPQLPKRPLYFSSSEKSNIVDFLLMSIFEKKMYMDERMNE